MGKKKRILSFLFAFAMMFGCLSNTSMVFAEGTLENEPSNENVIELKIGESRELEGDISSEGENPGVISVEKKYGDTYNKVAYDALNFKVGKEEKYLMYHPNTSRIMTNGLLNNKKNRLELIDGVNISSDKATISGKKYSKYLWTITQTADESEYKYIIQDKDGKYLDVLLGDSADGLGLSKDPKKFKIIANTHQATQATGAVSIGTSDGYLNKRDDNYMGTWTGVDGGNAICFYKPEVLSVTVTGAKVGTTNITVGGTEYTVTVTNEIELEFGQSVELEGDISLIGANSNVVNIEKKYGDTYNKMTYDALNFNAGKEKYLIYHPRSNRIMINNLLNNNQNRLELISATISEDKATISGNYSEYLWTITPTTDETEYKYIIQDKNGKYLDVLSNNSTDGLGLSNEQKKLKIVKNSTQVTEEACTGALFIGASNSGYANKRGDYYMGTWTGTDAGSALFFYKPEVLGITITGMRAGTTSITVGDTTYTVTVKSDAPIIASDNMSAEAGCQASESEAASNVLNDNKSQIWHSDYHNDSNKTSRDNHWITLDLGREYTVTELRYLTRNSGINGIITKYMVSYSLDNKNFIDIQSGTWDGEGDIWYEAEFSTPVIARYIKLRSLDSRSDVANEMFASAAKIELRGVVNKKPIIVSDAITATAGSANNQNANANESAGAAVDGRPGTFWHTNYGNDTDQQNRNNHWITIDLGREYTVEDLRYLTRDDGDNGIVTNYTISCSLDNITFTDIKSGIWDGEQDTWYEAEFPTPVVARYIKLKSNGSKGNGTSNVFATASEIELRGVVNKKPVIVSDAITATAGSQAKTSGNESASAVLNNNKSEIWHSDYSNDNDKTSRTNHWITLDLGHEYIVEDLRYLTRNSGINGIITSYTVSYSLDNVTFTDIKSGTWEGEQDTWYEAEFPTSVVARYIKLRSLDSRSDTANQMFASAAKIELRGVKLASYTALDQAITTARQYEEVLYTNESWASFKQVLIEAEAVTRNQLADAQPDIDAMTKKLTDAMTALVRETVYSEENPFVFPDEENVNMTLEMERLELHNTGENEKWPLKVAKDTWENEVKYIDSLNGDDSIILYYDAPKAGVYTAELTYRSGSDTNSIMWSEEKGKILNGDELAASENKDSTVTRKVTFRFVVTQPGPGVLTFKGGAANAPQMDKIDITLETEHELGFNSVSLSLHNDLAVNYKVNAETVERYGSDNVWAEFKVLNHEANEVSGVYDENSEKYVFKFEGIAPQWMNDTIEATLCAKVGDVTYKSAVQEYSVYTYLTKVLAAYNSDENAKIRTLVVDLLNYGSAAQVYENPEATELANRDITAEQQEKWAGKLPTTKSVKAVVTERKDATVYWHQTDLVLEDSVKVRYYIKFVPSDDFTKDNLYIMAEPKDGTGRSWKIDSFEDAGTVTENGTTYSVYRVCLEDLNAADMRTQILTTVFSKTSEQALSDTISYSIESYVHGILNPEEDVQKPSEELVNLVTTMLKYGCSARNYVSNN